MSTRAAGLLVAGVTLAGVLGLIAWSQLSSRPGAGEQTPTAAPSPAPPLATNRPPVDPQSIQDLVAGADEGRIELVDEQNRVVQELLYAEFIPQEAGRFNVTAPRAWLYAEGNRTITIDAEALSFIQPRGSREPEKGRFSGSVRVRVFETEAGVPAPRADDDAELPEPVLTVLTDSLVFDTSIGEVSTADPVRILASGVEAGFTGFSVVIDEQRKRLAFLRAERAGRVRIAPDELRRRPSAVDGEGAGDGRQAQANITHYRAEFRDKVRLAAGPRTLAADTLELWAELVDGALRDDAIAAYSGGGRAEGSGGGASGDAGTGEEIVLSWDGPLVVRPLESAPAELRDEALAVRFTAPVSGGVALADAQSGGTARSGTLEYGLTSRRVAMSGAGLTGVSVRVPGAMEMLAGRVEMDLTTGLGGVPGPGVLRALDDAPGAPDRRITWQERADVSLATRAGQVDFSDPALLREAIFQGEAEARYAQRTVRGDFIRAAITQGAHGAALTRVIVEGGARADAGEDGTLEARRVEVEFDPDKERITPTLVTAQGGVRAERGGASLEAELVEAQVAEAADASGETELRVSHLRADLGVVVRTPEGEEASGDQLRADVGAGVFDLTGAPVVIRRDASAITGQSVRIEEHEERMTVFGAGQASYARPSAGGQGFDRAQVEWKRSLVYDGRAGVVEISGECWATAEMDEYSRDHARADRVVIDLVRDGDGRAAADADRVAGAISRARLYGVDEGGTQAEVESRQYASDETSDSGLRLESIVYLSSALIDVDVEADTLVVPGAGRLLIDDRRPGEEREASRELAGDVRGTALFEWAGELTMSRRSGEADMRRDVRLRHLTPGGADITDMECERISALVRFPAEGSGAVELLTAEAAGAVYLRRGTRQLIADALEYDAQAGVAQATSAPGNVVTMFDSTRPTPLTGALLRWDLVRDRVEWRDAGETSAPR